MFTRIARFTAIALIAGLGTAGIATTASADGRTLLPEQAATQPAEIERESIAVARGAEGDITAESGQSQGLTLRFVGQVAEAPADTGTVGRGR